MTGRELLVHVDDTTDPLENLSREEDVFGQVENDNLREVVRFWVNRECLVRGKARSARYGWYDEQLARKMGILVVERSTGGGVVYHDFGNLNWSFFLKTSGGLLSPRAVFDQGSKYVVEALRSLGLPASFSPPNRIDVLNRKVSGMAARSTIHTLLVHGTLLINSDLEKLNLLCYPPENCPPVSNLSEWLEDIDSGKIIDAIVRALEASGSLVKMVGSLRDFAQRGGVQGGRRSRGYS